MDIQVDFVDEPDRGCGQRKSGPSGVGLYLVGGGIPMHCGRIPFPLGTCEHCGHAYGHSRGFAWINPQLLFASDKSPSLIECDGRCLLCPMGNLDMVGDQAGLMWVGRQFYTPESFRQEAFSHPNGICKRINDLPSNFVIGRHVVYLAHVDACKAYDHDEGIMVEVPGIFMVFKPLRLEGVIDDETKIPERAVKLKETLGDKFRVVKIVSRDEDEEDDGESDSADVGDGSFLLSGRQLEQLAEYP